MRPGAGFHASPSPVPTPAGTSSLRSSLHTPIPYLFGGLAAMFGLIALSLLILGCSYIKKLSHHDDDDTTNSDQHEDEEKQTAVYVQQFVVIMAGDDKPTFLATPMSRRAAGDSAVVGSKDEKCIDGKKVEEGVSEPDTERTPEDRYSHPQNQQ